MPQRIELLQLGDAFGNGDSIPQHAEKPPKQKDKTKSKPKVDQEYSEKSATPDNPYSAYQYEFPYQYPYNFFNMAPPSTSSHSGTDTKNKTKKKPSGNAQNVKKLAKEPDKTVVPFISISVAPHQPKGDIDSQSTQNDASDTEASTKTVYSPDKKPSPDQAAYFNYLNTYTPSHHNQEPIQHVVQSADIDKYNQLNAFSRYPIQYGFGMPANAANAYGYGYGYSPYSGYNQILGRMPFFNVAPIDAASGIERSTDAKSHDSARKVKSSTNHASSRKSARNS